ncbi:UDP-N-acetylmuramoyl-L-alanine--D-glutamate ligase [Aureibacillus halotolerans]|uniref:UDP-N-acetylmuramoylalanine--D-glutamate ligase n=1 Tax=Aureibacillus halotolerans TaxID=1508390 RepID=A0A4R6UC47_9BACI|nr:UDP-N-acetylmuramoyl-L-alanine--D-glutamate ligase [Aureibacillus halotolerans]TDQ42325.1 UDP-N-acetylmuramoylalanine--D-glutamate ligase [Aureibacillus halotolerans]
MKEYTQLQGKSVLVVGLAKSGMAAVHALRKLGAIVTVNDQLPYKDNQDAQTLYKQGIQVVCGSHPPELVGGMDVVVKNPGVPYTNPVIEAAMQRGLPIWTEIELAYLLSEAPIIAITGSNGKTTTTTLISKMLIASGIRARTAGNIGNVAVEVAQQATAEDVLVMELSSFQLAGIESFTPQVSVLLNLYDAHLDYHGHRRDYFAAKAKLFQHGENQQAIFIQEAAVETLRAYDLLTISDFESFTSIGLSENGTGIDNGALYVKHQQVMKLEEIVLPGEHNHENIVAAVNAASIFGATTVGIRQVLTTFEGVSHRLQFVRSLHGRLFYNDSKATNTLATITALKAFKAPVILIAGGLDRGQGFDDLKGQMKNVKAMVVFGETKEKLTTFGESEGIDQMKAVDNVEEAVQTAYTLSASGDVVLLSPACASWDQFRTFEERGDMFIQSVHTLN